MIAVRRSCSAAKPKPSAKKNWSVPSRSRWCCRKRVGFAPRKATISIRPSLSYKAGDGFKFAAKGRSNQPVLILDSTGRAYTVAAHNLPSARGQGEPLTGRISPPSGATFEGLLMGSESQQIVLASDAGYGFVTKLAELEAKNKNGKAVLTLPDGSRVVAPALIADASDAYVVAAANDGRMLMFPLSELPQLARGKGNKIIGITVGESGIARRIYDRSRRRHIERHAACVIGQALFEFEFRRA